MIYYQNDPLFPFHSSAALQPKVVSLIVNSVSTQVLFPLTGLLTTYGMKRQALPAGEDRQVGQMVVRCGASRCL